MSAPANTVRIAHGKTIVDVPRDIFVGDEAEVDREKAAAFRDMIGARYPWLSEGSLDVLMNKARKEVLRTMDEDTKGLAHARVLRAKGDIEGTIRHLRRCAERYPDEPDVWYMLAQCYSDIGDQDACFKAMNRARSLI